jgi:predicted amidohydrolase YtcJ
VSLEVGTYADIIRLSENLFEIPQNDIRGVEPLLTVVGGMEVYRSSGSSC